MGTSREKKCTEDWEEEELVLIEELEKNWKPESEQSHSTAIIKLESWPSSWHDGLHRDGH